MPRYSIICGVAGCCLRDGWRVQRAESPMTGSSTLRVKFTAKGHRSDDMAVWSRQLPGAQDRWGRCVFTFDPDDRDYDWLVVYDDLAPSGPERFSKRVEELACPRRHTLFVTAEPSTIKVYGSAFLNQFGSLLTSQESWATPHPGAVHAQPALRWFYGVPWHWKASRDRLRDWDAMQAAAPTAKDKVISTVTSSKQMAATEHRARFAFIGRLRNEMAELDAFGHGVQLIDDKADALDGYCYHVAVENHVCPHHITEKLSDAFLGCTLPFYSGAPNAADYYPADSFIPIDIHNFDGTLRTIRDAIANNEYEKRLPAILEARRRVLEEHNIFAVIERLVSERHDPAAIAEPEAVIYSRHRARARSPMSLFSYWLESRSVRRRHHRAGR